jgi:enoyl-CoA hydratase/carnithine racemase
VATELLAAGALRVDWHGPNGEPVVTVTLARPERRNAQTPATWRALAAVGSALPTGTRVVVLRGDGPSFSAGIDLRAFSPEGIDGETPFTDIALADDATAAAHIAVFQSGFTWLHDRSDIITVAVVRGAAVGAGFQLALACDLRVCADDTRFAMKETGLGLVPDLTGTHPLVDAVGYSRALEICLTGRWVEAASASRRQSWPATLATPRRPRSSRPSWPRPRTPCAPPRRCSATRSRPTSVISVGSSARPR